MTYCTSTNCPYIKTCGRQDRSEPENREDTYYNFEINGCDVDNGFSDYIKGDDKNY